MYIMYIVSCIITWAIAKTIVLHYFLVKYFWLTKLMARCRKNTKLFSACVCHVFMSYHMCCDYKLIHLVNVVAKVISSSFLAKIALFIWHRPLGSMTLYSIRRIVLYTFNLVFAFSLCFHLTTWQKG